MVCWVDQQFTFEVHWINKLIMDYGQWPEVYDLCHTFCTQKNPRTCQKSTRFSCNSRMSVGFLTRATCDKIWYLGTLPNVIVIVIVLSSYYVIALGESYDAARPGPQAGYQSTNLNLVVIWVQSLSVRQAFDRALAAWAQFKSPVRHSPMPGQESSSSNKALPR